MLIQLSIENFKSVKEEQIIDFYAPLNRTEHQDNTFPLECAKMRILRSVGLYGANAAGKSNVFNALGAIVDLIVDDRFKPDTKIAFYDPYRLDEKMRRLPTRFSLEFVLPEDGILSYRRFLYEISFNGERVYGERLQAFPDSGRRVTLFSRHAKDSYKTIRVAPFLLNEGKRVSCFNNQAYLSAAWKSAEAPEMLRVVASYLCGKFRLSKYKKSAELSSLKHGRIAAALLPYADFGIRKVVERKRKIDPESIATMQRLLSQEEFEEALLAMKRKGRGIGYAFAHSSDLSHDNLIKLEEESDGTQIFFRKLPRIMEVLDNGLTMLEDEIDRSMHPFLAEFIIRLFNDPEVNVHNAQLLFSTHNLALLSESLLRKDQVWFAEKHDGASSYYSLQDFEDDKVDARSPFSAWYVEGRFGGVPCIDYDGFVKSIKRLREEATHA